MVLRYNGRGAGLSILVVWNCSSLQYEIFHRIHVRLSWAYVCISICGPRYYIVHSTVLWVAARIFRWCGYYYLVSYAIAAVLG